MPNIIGNGGRGVFRPQESQDEEVAKRDLRRVDTMVAVLNQVDRHLQAHARQHHLDSVWLRGVRFYLEGRVKGNRVVSGLKISNADRQMIDEFVEEAAREAGLTLPRTRPARQRRPRRKKR